MDRLCGMVRVASVANCRTMLCIVVVLDDNKEDGISSVRWTAVADAVESCEEEEAVWTLSLVIDECRDTLHSYHYQPFELLVIVFIYCNNWLVLYLNCFIICV